MGKNPNCAYDAWDRSRGGGRKVRQGYDGGTADTRVNKNRGKNERNGENNGAGNLPLCRMACRRGGSVRPVSSPAAADRWRRGLLVCAVGDDIGGEGRKSKIRRRRWPRAPAHTRPAVTRHPRTPMLVPGHTTPPQRHSCDERALRRSLSARSLSRTLSRSLARSLVGSSHYSLSSARLGPPVTGDNRARATRLVHTRVVFPAAAHTGYRRPCRPAGVQPFVRPAAALSRVVLSVSFFFSLPPCTRVSHVFHRPPTRHATNESWRAAHETTKVRAHTSPAVTHQRCGPSSCAPQSCCSSHPCSP